MTFFLHYKHNLYKLYCREPHLVDLFIVMEESKRDVNKSKRPKSDHVKNLVQCYLQKRNYSANILEKLTIEQQITYSSVESGISRPNSVLYSCHNSDPVVIDHNFTKFVAWIKDLVKNKNKGQDLEFLIGPLFCHLYLDILKSGHPDKATNFLKAHVAAIDKTKCDDFVKDLINLIANDNDATILKERFRGNKYLLRLSQNSLALLRKFVLENCHVVFLHILQTWFELEEIAEIDYESEEEQNNMEDQSTSNRNGVHTDDKLQKLYDLVNELENEHKQIFLLNISNTKDPVTCGFINRSASLIAYAQHNIICLRPIHSFDLILGRDCKEVKFIEHSDQVYSLTITKNHKYLISGSADSNVCIFDLEQMSLWKTCKGHLGPVHCVATSSNNIYAASGSQDQLARLWNIETGITLRIFVGHSQTITSIDFHPNCLYVLSGSADRNLRLWSVDNGECLRLFHGSKGIIYSVMFSPLGDVICSVSDDKKIRFWDVLSSKINSEIKYKGEPITKLAWSADAKQICSGSLDGTLRVFNTENVNHETIDKNQEPVQCFNVNGKILGLEHQYETFACISTVK